MLCYRNKTRVFRHTIVLSRVVVHGFSKCMYAMTTMDMHQECRWIQFSSGLRRNSYQGAQHGWLWSVNGLITTSHQCLQRRPGFEARAPASCMWHITRQLDGSWGFSRYSEHGYPCLLNVSRAQVPSFSGTLPVVPHGLIYFDAVSTFPSWHRSPSLSGEVMQATVDLIIGATF